MYVQYGCGLCAPEGWVNFDASPTLRFERLPVVGHLYTRNAQRFPAAVRYGDIVKGLPIAASSCDGIYASHILEHLALADCRAALRNTLSYLKPGGIFRLVVPDLADIARAYASDGDAQVFMQETGLGRASRPRGLRSMARAAMGNSEHLWMWDERSMGEALLEAGFSRIRAARFGDAEDPMFGRVENEERFDRALAMQAWR